MKLEQVPPNCKQTLRQAKEKVVAYMKDMGYKEDEWRTYDRVGTEVVVVTEDGNDFYINVAA